MENKLITVVDMFDQILKGIPSFQGTWDKHYAHYYTQEPTMNIDPYWGIELEPKKEDKIERFYYSDVGCFATFIADNFNLICAALHLIENLFLQGDEEVKSLVYSFFEDLINILENNKRIEDIKFLKKNITDNQLNILQKIDAFWGTKTFQS